MFGEGESLFNTAGTSALGMGDIMPGLGGALIGQQVFGNNTASNIGGLVGGIGGSFFGPLGSAAGSFLGEGIGNSVSGTFGSGNTFNNIGKDIHRAIGSPF